MSLKNSFSSSINTPLTSVIDEQPQPFPVSYLMNSCGLSLASAISASKSIQFETPCRPDSVLNLLRAHGFTETQISKLVRSRPKLLMADPAKILLPKIEFFRSLGFSSTDVGNVLSANPSILHCSLKNQIKPWYNFLKDLLVDDTKVVKALKNSFRVCLPDVQKHFATNIAVLRQHGVHESVVSFMVTFYSNVMGTKLDKFDKVVKEVIEMGFNPKHMLFSHAILVFVNKSKSTRECKMEVYKRCGWSQDEVLLAFKKFPLCLALSEEKIVGTLDFLVNKLGYQSASIAKVPCILSLSLDKRIIPRCSVIRLLQLKGLIKKDFNLSSFLILRNKDFLDKFVTKYQKDIPQLLNVYQGKLNLLELGFKSEEISGMTLL